MWRVDRRSKRRREGDIEKLTIAEQVNWRSAKGERNKSLVLQKKAQLLLWKGGCCRNSGCGLRNERAVEMVVLFEQGRSEQEIQRAAASIRDSTS